MKLTDKDLRSRNLTEYNPGDFGLSLKDGFWIEVDLNEKKAWLSHAGKSIPLQIGSVKDLDTLLAVAGKGAQGQN